MPSKPSTVKEFLAQLSEDRLVAIEALRKVIRKNIDKKFEEGIQDGTIAYYLPHSVYPNGYHCDPKQPLPFAGVSSTKGHIGLHLFCIYANPEDLNWFQTEWKKTGKRLDMGKSCVRMKKFEDIPLELIGKLFKRIKAKDFVASYEASLAGNWGKGSAPAKKAAAKKKKAKKKSVKKKFAVTRKTVSKKKPAAAKKQAAKKKKAAPKR